MTMAGGGGDSGRWSTQGQQEGQAPGDELLLLLLLISFFKEKLAPNQSPFHDEPSLGKHRMSPFQQMLGNGAKEAIA